MMRYALFCLALLFSQSDAQSPDELPSIDDLILSDANLTTLAAAFNASGLAGSIPDNLNFTAFAPINEAFEQLDPLLVEKLLTPSWLLHLQRALSFHFTLPSQDRVLSSSLTDGLELEMLIGESVTINIADGTVSVTSPLTAGSDVVEADILASNGVVHKVDAVLLPDFFNQSVLDLGAVYPEFSILSELIALAGLSETAGDFTVLAPVNAAFEALGTEVLEDLKADTETLSGILLNHVIAGVSPSILLGDGQSFASLGGLTVNVMIDGTAVMFNDASVLRADLLGVNGIAHAIDSIIMDSAAGSDVPSSVPSDIPSSIPSSVPSSIPSAVPSDSPSTTPSSTPSAVPSDVPSSAPSSVPSSAPTNCKGKGKGKKGKGKGKKGKSKKGEGKGKGESDDDGGKGKGKGKGKGESDDDEVDDDGKGKGKGKEKGKGKGKGKGNSKGECEEENGKGKGKGKGDDGKGKGDDGKGKGKGKKKGDDGKGKGKGKGDDAKGKKKGDDGKGKKKAPKVKESDRVRQLRPFNR